MNVICAGSAIMVLAIVVVSVAALESFPRQCPSGGDLVLVQNNKEEDLRLEPTQQIDRYCLAFLIWLSLTPTNR